MSELQNVVSNTIETWDDIAFRVVPAKPTLSFSVFYLTVSAGQGQSRMVANSEHIVEQHHSQLTDGHDGDPSRYRPVSIPHIQYGDTRQLWEVFGIKT